MGRWQLTRWKPLMRAMSERLCSLIEQLDMNFLSESSFPD